jgi:hypothetical protein
MKKRRRGGREGRREKKEGRKEGSIHEFTSQFPGPQSYCYQFQPRKQVTKTISVLKDQLTAVCKTRQIHPSCDKKGSKENFKTYFHYSLPLPRD